MPNQTITPTFSLSSSHSNASSFTLHPKDFFHGRRTPSQTTMMRKRLSSQDLEPPQHDGTASLTYSAASSIAGDSTADGSTDSSFADIIRVIDAEELHAGKNSPLRRGAEAIPSEFESRNRKVESEQFVSGSLAYSSDGESNLEGTNLIQLLAGSTDYRKNETLQGDSGPLMFAPAVPGRVRKNKVGQDQNPRFRVSTTLVPEPLTPQPRGESMTYQDSSPASSSHDTPTRSPPTTRSLPGDGQSSPSHSKRRFFIEDAEGDDNVWYTKWWFLCFPVGITDFLSKRYKEGVAQR